MLVEFGLDVEQMPIGSKGVRVGTGQKVELIGSAQVRIADLPG